MNTLSLEQMQQLDEPIKGKGSEKIWMAFRFKKSKMLLLALLKEAQQIERELDLWVFCIQTYGMEG